MRYFQIARNPSRIDAKRGDHFLQADLPVLISANSSKPVSVPRGAARKCSQTSSALLRQKPPVELTIEKVHCDIGLARGHQGVCRCSPSVAPVRHDLFRNALEEALRIDGLGYRSHDATKQLSLSSNPGFTPMDIRLKIGAQRHLSSYCGLPDSIRFFPEVRTKCG